MSTELQLAGYNVSPLTMIFPVEGDKILTLKRAADKKIFPGKLSGFGGKVEPGEDLISSAYREMLEETGLDARNMQLRGVLTRVLENGYINQLFIFVATGLIGEPVMSGHEGTAHWLSVSDFLVSPDIVEHIPLYLKQVIAGQDFYCGIAQYDGSRRIGYTDNAAHFAQRR